MLGIVQQRVHTLLYLQLITMNEFVAADHITHMQIHTVIIQVFGMQKANRSVKITLDNALNNKTSIIHNATTILFTEAYPFNLTP